MLRRLLILTILASFPLSAFAGPETADEVRARRAKQQLESNRAKQDRDAKAAELEDLPEIDALLVKKYTEMLDVIADPSMEGRIPGSRGIEDAAQYIESHLIELGLTPAFPTTQTTSDGTEVITPFTDFRQQIQMGSQAAPTTETLTVGTHTFEPGVEFSPLAYSGSVAVNAPVSFVGYAIVSGPNNYLGFETTESIEGRIAMCLNYEPMDEEGLSLWRDGGKWSHNSRLTYKVTALERRGASAVIIVSPPNASDSRVHLLETIESTSPPSTKIGKQTGPQYDIPVIHVTPDVARAILAHTQSDASIPHTLESLIEQANQSGTVLPLGDEEISMDIEIERSPKWTSNIGAILPGKGALKDEYVVIGSHYDHVGYGKFGSRMPNRKGEVHPGADDNGTGTTANILSTKTLAQRYQLLADNEDARSILFLWFTAEESGLNGSRYYTQNPIVPIKDHVVMLNMDMIGTLSDGLLEVGGFKSAKGFPDFATPHLNNAAVPYSTEVSVGEGRSDHASFDAVAVPNLFFFTGLHERYHSPDDTTELIDEEGCVRVSLIVSSMAYDAATRQARLVHPASGAKKPAKEGPNVRVGIIPSNSSKGGMNIERIFEDTSASAAGLRTGDRVTHWNGQEIDSVEAWMPILTANEPGDIVKLTVIRGDETLELEMTLRGIE
ncbi:MAG: M28 family peptidase [Phycisphaerales bacterium]|nr:M28 family peptidase [Phycisphaerales bacterium]